MINCQHIDNFCDGRSSGASYLAISDQESCMP
jgi:hypothetical protein